jgi:uncharacterized protein YndB with AHSA1/START domain
MKKENIMQKIEHVYVTYIRATPEQTWAALTKPEFTRLYMAGGESISDWKPGSKWQHVNADGKRTVRVAGEVLESVPRKRLVLTWADPANPTDDSRLTYEIEPVEDMVRLTVIHGGFKEGSVMAGRVSQGWPRALSSMKSLLETGKGLNVWSEPGARCANTPTEAVAA